MIEDKKEICFTGREIKLGIPSEYEAALLKNRVIASFDRRRRCIERQLKRIAKEEEAVEEFDEELILEVTGLTEWPVVVCCKIEEEFLELPKEVIITSMKKHQKCFPLIDSKGDIIPKFLVVSNLPSLDIREEDLYDE